MDEEKNMCCSSFAKQRSQASSSARTHHEQIRRPFLSSSEDCQMSILLYLENMNEDLQPQF